MSDNTNRRDRVYAATGIRSAAARLRREAADYRSDDAVFAPGKAIDRERVSQLLERLAKILESEAGEMVRGFRIPGLDPDWLRTLGVDECDLRDERKELEKMSDVTTSDSVVWLSGPRVEIVKVEFVPSNVDAPVAVELVDGLGRFLNFKITLSRARRLRSLLSVAVDEVEAHDRKERRE